MGQPTRRASGQQVHPREDIVQAFVADGGSPVRSALEQRCGTGLAFEVASFLAFLEPIGEGNATSFDLDRGDALLADCAA